MESIREGGRTIRMNTNRREDVSMLQELKDVNNKTLKEIATKRKQKQLATPNEEELYKRKMGPQFIPEPPKRERKTHPIFHDDIKTKDFKKDQYLVMPTVPAYSPVDPGPKIVLESRSRKYPYVHKKLTTTEEMKRPRVSTLGVLPVRSSTEIVALNVMMEGGPAPLQTEETIPSILTRPQEPKLYNTPASSFVVPKLPLGRELGTDAEKISEGEERLSKDGEATKRKESQDGVGKSGDVPRKPAILAGEGTSLTVKFHERAKPAPKQSFLKDKYRTARGLETVSRPSTGASVRSSLLSGDLTLPDEAVYKKYDDAIAHMDDVDDVETAVGVANKSQSSRPDSVKSVKELLEEAKRIASPGSVPVYKQVTTTVPTGQGDTDGEGSYQVKVHARRPGGKSAKSTRSSKSSKSGKDGKVKDKRKAAQKQESEVEEKRGERTVDEIIASLKDQSAYQVETAADRKIKAIMSRVMSRTNLDLDEKDDGETDEDGLAATGSDSLLAVPAGDADLKSSPAMTPDDSPRVEGGSIASADAFGGSMKDILAAQEQIVEESEGDGVSVTTKTTETVPAGLEQADREEGNESDLSEDYVDLDYENVGLQYVELEQAWEDLLAPAESTNEDILNVQGEQKDLQGRGMPGPPYPGSKSNVVAPSVSFLATWGPATSRTKKEKAGEIKGKQDREFKNNIHHFCRMSTEYQLPAELMHAGRKYHTPDRFPSVMPDQSYRFQAGELSPLLESESHSASSSVRLDRAAHRVVLEAHKAQAEAGGVGGAGGADQNPVSLFEWQQRAENLLSENDVLAGGRAAVRTDESQVYWNPAPPKLGAISNVVREILFPQYCVEELDEFGRVRVPVPGDEESDSSEEEEEETISPQDKAAIERTVRRRHNSSETLTAFSREKTLMSMYSKMDEDPSDKTSSYRGQDDADTEYGDVDPAVTSGVDGEAAPAVVIPDGAGGGDDADAGILTTEGEGGEDDVAAQLGDSLSVDAGPSRKTERDKLQQRPYSAPNLVATDDDTLIVPQDFNTAIHEITEQKKLLEKAKRQVRVQEAFEELEQMEKLEQLELKEKEEKAEEEEETTTVQQDLQDLEDYNILTVRHPPKPAEEELTPAEKALLAGRNYVILPKKKKKSKRGRRTMDVAKIEAVEKMLTEMPPNRLKRHGSMPKLNKIIEREMRVSWQVRSYRASIPDLLNFEEYKSRKRMPANEEEREWVRAIWNKWFDEVFPPTPEVSEDEDEVEETTNESVEKKEEKKKKKDPVSDILSQDVEEIEPIADTPENAEIYQILSEEIEKLSDVIGKMFNPSAFHFCRRGALYRKIGQLKKAENDLDRAISMEPGLLDAYWHRHLLYILQDRKSAALEDLNFIMKTNKNHSGAYRSMAEIYKRQDDITMAIINYSSAIKYNPLDHEAYYQRAQLYEQRGEMLLAMEDYTKAMRIMPSRTDAIMKHGMYYFENENWNHAVNDFTELLRVDPLNSTAYLFRGRAYAKMSNWVPAVHDLSSAIHLDPYSWQAFYQRACILRKAHPMRALQDYSVSLLLNDSEENLMSYLHRGILYNTLGKPEDAIPDFESVLRLNKDIAAAHVNLGLIYMTKHSNFHRAIKKFSSAVKVDPTYVRAYVCRAEAYHKIHDVKNALKDFTRAIHLRPDMHHFYMHRGQLVLELGNLDLAGFCVRHASELGATSPSSSTFGGSPTQQAVVQSFLKNYEKAVDALQQASREKPIAPYFMMLGKTHMKAKQFQEAVHSFKQALDKMYPWRKRDPWPPEAADAHHLCGLCHMELRNYSEALTEFNQAIKLRPNFADAYYQRGLASVKMRQMKGIQDFNRALALNPNIFQAYLSRACYYGMKGKYAKAILNCNEAIRLRPRSVRAYLYRGSLKYHIKAYELAILDLSKAAAIDTQCALPFFNRAVCYHENRQYDKALSDYGIVLLLGNMLGLKVLINRGLLYFEQGDFMNALFDFQAAATFSPNDHRIHHTLGLCFHKLNRLQEAVATFSQCLRLKPFFLDGYIGRGNVFMDYGHKDGLELARRDYQRALRLDPQCLPARINLAYTAQVSGKLMQAWKHFTAVIEVSPQYKPALEGRAIVSLQMSSTFAAYQDISASINCGATAELLTNRGVINQFMGDRVMAMQDYQRALKLDPTYALAYFNAGNVYFHTRHFQQALEYYKKATVYNPNDESAFLNLAITKVLLHDPQGALADFKMAAKLAPFSAHIYFNRANLFASLQQFEKAEREYSKALELKPDDALMLKRRADVRGKLGRAAEAIEDYQRAVDIQTRPNKLLPPPARAKSKSKAKN